MSVFMGECRALAVLPVLIPGHSRKAALGRRVTDCLEVVSIGIEHESPIVVRMIMGAQAGRAVIFSARGYCCARTRQPTADRSPRLRRE